MGDKNIMNKIYLQYKDESWHLEYIPCGMCDNVDCWLERYQELHFVEIIDYEIDFN